MQPIAGEVGVRPGQAALRDDTDNARDNVFSDGVEHQLLEVSGDVTTSLKTGFTAVV